MPTTVLQPELQSELRLAGGIVLLPATIKKFRNQKFALGQPYGLGDGPTFAVERSSFVGDAFNALNLWRMDNLSQLQRLAARRVCERTRPGRGVDTFPHRRLLHSTGAAALFGYMLDRCGYDNERKAQIGVLSSAIHDNHQFAGGDSWKDANYQGTLIDEDEAFAARLFRFHKEGWLRFCNHYRLVAGETAEELAQTVNGNGVFGEIQEIADTGSYLLLDVYELNGAVNRLNCRADYAEVFRAARERWDIWNFVEITSNYVVVTNPRALKNFLMLRILLWKELYQHPACKFIELLLLKVVYPFLLERGHRRKPLITLSQLPTKDDAWLFGQVVARAMGWQPEATTSLDLLGFRPYRQSFAAWQEALVFEEEQFKAGAFTLVVNGSSDPEHGDFQPIKSKITKYRVLDAHGKPSLFKDACPVEAAEIERIAEEVNNPSEPMHVYYVPGARQRIEPRSNFERAWNAARWRWQRRSV